MGGGEREREEDCLFSAPRSHAQIIVNAAGKKKSLQVGREIRFAPQKLPGTEEFWLSKPTSPFKVDRL